MVIDNHNTSLIWNECGSSSNLTMRELKDIYRICGQPVGSNKDEIITRLVEFLSALSDIYADTSSHFEERDTE